MQTRAWRGAPGSKVGAGTVLDDGPEQRPQVGARHVPLGRRPAGPGVGVEDGEADLVLVGVEVQEQLLDLVDHVVDPGVGPVDLVHDQHHRQAGLERLAQDEAGLGQGALRGVDQQQDAVDHGEPALDLPAEVGVARRVDDVDLHTLVGHGRVLGQDGDALLALEVTRVEDPVGHLLVGPEGPGLPEHGVDQGGLAVIDVGHDRHVADIGPFLHRAGPYCPPGGARTPMPFRGVGAGLRPCRRVARA